MFIKTRMRIRKVGMKSMRLSYKKNVSSYLRITKTKTNA